MHFCVVHAYFFSSGSKVIKGVKRSNSFFNGPKKSTISKCKNNSANVFYMDRDTKVSTVTQSSDLPLRGHFRFLAEKLREFLSQELSLVECFNLKWNNAFL